MIQNNNISYQFDLFCNPHGDTFNCICDKLGCDSAAPAWPDKFGMSIKSWLENNGIKPIRTLSLFSGAGGLDIGFSDIGFDIVSSVEIEKQFCQTLELNTGDGKRFKNSKVNCIDIRIFSAKDLGPIDFIIGGPPCQTFSAAGRRANGVLGTTDARGTLFKEYVRLLKELNPRGFLFENVYGIVGAQNGEAWKEILEEFSKIGYKLYYRIVDAADYGVPQHRERLLIVGLKDGLFKFPRPTHGPDSLDNQAFYNAETAIAGVISNETDNENKLGGRFASLLDDIPPGLNYSFYTEEMGHPNPIFSWRSKFSDFLYKADPNAPVRTIKASGGAYTGPLHWENRFFKYEEYKRLQTFPDDYVISGKKQVAVKQIGNSVPPQLARIMAISIRQQVFNTDFPFELSLMEDFEKLSFRTRKHSLSEMYREKAKIAIESIKNHKQNIPKSHNYYSILKNNFEYLVSDENLADYFVEVLWENNLVINLADCSSKSKDQLFYNFNIKPVSGWSLNIDNVIINVFSENFFAYTAAWKAFEYELKKNNIKADLVQLNGYYQYDSSLLIESNISQKISYASLLQSILSGKNVAEFVTTKELSEAWNILPNEILETAKYLKKIGYEIRNNSTNPQIAKETWLIPYKFPTLSKQSVQLWKNLM